MSLQSGIYLISSKADNRIVGRFPVEDRSLLPKRVLAYEADEETRLNEFVRVIENPEGTYDIHFRGAPTGRIDNKLRALLIQEDGKASWRLNSLGEDDFTVTEDETGEGWAIDLEREYDNASDIIIQPLHDEPNINEIFHFQRVDHD